jgi:hypothetical protein
MMNNLLQFFLSKIAGEVLEILDRISTSVGTDEESSNVCQGLLPTIDFIKTRAHALRLASWNGSMEKITSKT